MWTRESLEAQIAKRARAVPGVESVYIGPPNPAATKDQRSYVAVVYGGAQWGRPTLNTQPRRYDISVSAFVHAVDRGLMFDIADALVVSLGGLKNVTITESAEEQESNISFIQLAVGAANDR